MAATSYSPVFADFSTRKDLSPKNAVISDRVYISQTSEGILLKRSLEYFIMSKANRNAPLSDEDKIYNKKVSRILVRVEHVFGRMKHMNSEYSDE